MSRISYFAYSLILLCILAAGSSCAPMRDSGASSGMEMIALDSGMDKKAMAPMESEEMAMGGASGNSQYDSQYRDQTRSPSYSYSADLEVSPGAENTDIPADGVMRSIEDWLNPKAWAQDELSAEQYIIRNGNIEMEIDDYDQSSAEVQTIAKRHGAIITDSQMQKYGDDMRVGWITLRVPSDKFQQCFDDLKEVGEVKVQNVSSEDVTNEYIAGVSRMEALTTEHQTLQGMLEDAREIQRTRGLGEAYSVLLDTQKRLSQVTTELQTVENRVSALRDRINRSTITVNLSERPLAPPPDEFAWGIGSAFENAKKDLLHGIDYTGSAVVYWLVNGLVWWIIWLAIIWLAWMLFIRHAWRAFSRWALTKGDDDVASERN